MASLSFDDLPDQNHALRDSGINFDDLPDEKESILSQAFSPIRKVIPYANEEAKSGLDQVLSPLPSSTGSIIGNFKAGEGDVFNRALGAARYIGSPITGAARAIAGEPASKVAQSAGLSPESAKAYVEDPVTAAASLFGPAGASKYLPTAADVAGAVIDKFKAVPSMLAELAADDATLPSITKVKPSYDPEATHSAISDAYGAAKDTASRYYNFMRQVAHGKSAPADGIAEKLHSIIGDIQATPFHEAASELPYLRTQAKKIGESDTLPLNDLVKLKQNLNNNFNPKRFNNGSDSPYSELGSLVDKSLDKAAELHPQFGEAKSIADQNWINTVKSPFEDNTVLQNFWKPEDYFAKKSVDNGLLEELPDPTKFRAYTMLSKIKNPVQLNAVRRVLPEDLSDSLSQAKIQDITHGSGVSRLQSLGKTITGAPNLTLHGMSKTFRNAANVISPQYAPEQLRLIEAAKSSAPRLSTKYSPQFDDLQARVNTPPEPDTSQRLLTGPSPQLALPAPKSGEPFIAGSTPGNIRTPILNDIVADTNGNARPLGAGEQNATEAARIEAANTGLTPDVLRAQENMQKISPAEQTLDNIASGKTGYADGGKVGTSIIDRLASEAHPNPSEAQKEAGNYQKGHIRLHGLNISIENPKGAYRNGLDKDGKPWKAKMPAHYGYIRGTMARDGDHVDVFVGPNHLSQRVFIVDQINPHTGKYDEAKVMLGFPNMAAASKAYHTSFSDGKSGKRMGGIVQKSISEFKDWLEHGDTTKPVLKKSS